MKLTNAYIIDEDVIEKRIKQLRESNGNSTFNALNSELANELVHLKQHLKPAFPIVEEAFDAGREGKDTFEVKADFEFTTFNDYLKTKDFL